eukprot:11718420-Alexandrium_andersonii.AAC.1
MQACELAQAHSFSQGALRARGMTETGIFTLQGAQSAIHNPPKARQGSNPPQCATRPAGHAQSLQALGA